MRSERYILRRLLIPGAFVAALSACSGSYQDRCLRRALAQEDLSLGIVTYGSAGGSARTVKRSVLDFRGADARLPMASLTKPIVADQIRRKIEGRELRLDAPLKDVAPDMKFTSATGNLTLRQLLQHQGGFNRVGYDPLLMNGEPDCDFAVKFASEYGPELKAGSAVKYSNEGYCLLGKVLLRHAVAVPTDVIAALNSPIGGAGGWVAPLDVTYRALRATMPVHELPSSVALPDGSYYAYGWRRWPNERSYPKWTHFGRLPGFISVAATDGKDRLLVAHFTGDPRDVDRASARAVEALWQCMQSPTSDR